LPMQLPRAVSRCSSSPGPIRFGNGGYTVVAVVGTDAPRLDRAGQLAAWDGCSFRYQ